MREPFLLSVNNLSAGYGEAVILQHISFQMAAGETLALLGRNGTGKTSLIDTLAGATRQHQGEIILAGIELHKLPSFKRAKAGIGWVPQERNIFKSLTVHENLTAVARQPTKSAEGTNWTPERVYQLFPRLAERKLNLGTQLSGGEQQMLAIARTLMGNPDAVLLEEPSEGLAPVILELMAEAVLSMKREGIAVLLSEQNFDFAAAVADRAYVIERGEIRYDGSMAALEADPALRAQYLAL